MGVGAIVHGILTTPAPSSDLQDVDSENLNSPQGMQDNFDEESTGLYLRYMVIQPR